MSEMIVLRISASAVARSSDGEGIHVREILLSNEQALRDRRMISGGMFINAYDMARFDYLFLSRAAADKRLPVRLCGWCAEQPTPSGIVAERGRLS